MKTNHLFLLCWLGILNPLMAQNPTPPADSATALGTIYYVDTNKGNNSNPGTEAAPFQTIDKGIAKAQSGDTVKIVKTTDLLPAMVLIKQKSGEAGKPIILDGQGNTLSGAEPIKPGDWTLVKPGLYSNNHLMHGLAIGSKSNDAMTRRFYFLFDGVQNRMGRSSKGKQPALPAPDAMTPGQWSYDDKTITFYLCIDPAKTLADVHIEAPMREDGIAVRDTCEHWIVRNFNVTHVWNDGYNIHGHTRDFVFENITATECGDDGISEHEDSEITIHGLVSKHNSTGLCHGDDCVTTADHLDLEDNYGGNFIARNGTYTFTDCTISAAAGEGGCGGIRIGNQPVPACPGPTTITFTRCHFPFPNGANPDGKPPFLVNGDAVLTTTDCTIDGQITRIGQSAASTATK